MSSQNKALTNLEKKLHVEASRLARLGNYQDAEQLIGDAIQSNPTCPAYFFDLMAKIYVQQGHYQKAESYWKKAQLLEPDNSAYQAGLSRLAHDQHPSRWRLLFAVLILAVSIVFGWLWLNVTDKRDKARESFWETRWQGQLAQINQLLTAQLDVQGESVLTQVNDVNKRIQGMEQIIKQQSQQITELKGVNKQIQGIEQVINQQSQQISQFITHSEAVQKPQQPTNLSAEITIPLVELQIAGIRIMQEVQGTRIQFEQALFNKGARLNVTAKKVLAQLAQDLQSQFRSEMRIYIIGHTDNLPVKKNSMYRNNSQLGYMRAVAVAEYLRDAMQLPASVFSLTSKENIMADNSKESPKRTVEILLKKV